MPRVIFFGCAAVREAHNETAAHSSMIRNTHRFITSLRLVASASRPCARAGCPCHIWTGSRRPWTGTQVFAEPVDRDGDDNRRADNYQRAFLLQMHLEDSVFNHAD